MWISFTVESHYVNLGLIEISEVPF
jgi:hypothetical protein